MAENNTRERLRNAIECLRSRARSWLDSASALVDTALRRRGEAALQTAAQNHVCTPLLPNANQNAKKYGQTPTELTLGVNDLITACYPRLNRLDLPGKRLAARSPDHRAAPPNPHKSSLDHRPGDREDVRHPSEVAVRAKHPRITPADRVAEVTSDMLIAESFFYCSHCASPRVAGVNLHNLNRLPDHRGQVRDVVSQHEIDTIWAQVADPVRYFYYCFACCRFGNCIYDAELLARKFPEMMV